MMSFYLCRCGINSPAMRPLFFCRFFMDTHQNYTSQAALQQLGSGDYVPANSVRAEVRQLPASGLKTCLAHFTFCQPDADGVSSPPCLAKGLFPI